MAYTNIDLPTEYFNTKLYTGTGSNNITLDMDNVGWIWIKNRGATGANNIFDILRGGFYTGSGSKPILITNSTAAEQGTDITSSTVGINFGSLSTVIGSDAQGYNYNTSSSSYVCWHWKANETLSKTYAVTVVSSGGNKYRFDGFTTNAVTLEISEGGTFKFDQSDASNIGHPLRFSITSDGTHNSGVEYTTGVTVVGTAGYAGAYTEITVATSAPTLYYYCTVHSGMGGQANTPTTNSFSNLSGSIQSNISPNTTAGFSIVSYTGTGANATVGHGLGVAPKMIIIKNRSSATNWLVYHASLGNGNSIVLNTSGASFSAGDWQNTTPTSSIIYLSGGTAVNESSSNHIAYCFAEVKGYSKFGSYTGNGSTDGTFVYTGFKPAWVMVKASSTTGQWAICDNKRGAANILNNNGEFLFAEDSGATNSAPANWDFVSNGLKARANYAAHNTSGVTYIYMAFAENPFVSSTGIPTTAR